MWQFMPATGRDYDLKQNFFRDDRRDVLASTRAALDYLQRLHGMFGDWHLALAAYNWGEGNVGRAIAANRRRGLGTQYTDLKMPDETRNYVPKLQAVKNIVATPDQFQADLPVIENHPYFDVVTVPRDMDIALVAKLADVQLDDFKALNPHLNRPVILAPARRRSCCPGTTPRSSSATSTPMRVTGCRAGRSGSPDHHEARGGCAAHEDERGRPALRQPHPAAHADPRRLHPAGAASGQPGARRDRTHRRQRSAAPGA